MSPDSTGLAYDLGYVNAGGYVVFPLNVAQAGVYSLTLTYSSPTSGTGVNILVNGSNQASVSFANTGSWLTYSNAPAVSLSLPAGLVTLEIYAQSSGFNIGGIAVQNTAQVTSTSVSAQGSTSIALQNYSSIYGMSPDSTGLAYDLGYVNAGGDVVFPLNVAQAGVYSLTLSYSSPTGGTGVNILINGSNLATVNFANTGSWLNYTNAANISITLPAGSVNLEIYAQNSGFNIGGITLVPQINLSPLAYYVSPSGNDSNDGKTPNTAFATLQKAANVVQPGYTVYAMTGVYQNTDFASSSPSQNVLNIYTSGTQALPITFTNYPGQSPKIQFNSWYGIRVFGPASYITLSGFEIEGDQQQVSQTYAQSASYGDPLTNGTGISVTGDSSGVLISTHVTIENMVVHDCPLNGIGAGYSDYIAVQDNIVYNNGYWSPFAGSGISMIGLFPSDSNTKNYKNFILRNVSYGNNEVHPNFQAYNLITDGNGIILDSFNHQATSFQPYNGKTLVANNIVYSNGGTGISAYQSANIDLINNTAFANNLTMSIPIGEIVAYYASNINIVNNIMVAPTGLPVNTATGDTTVNVDYNLYYGGSGPQVMGSHDLIGNPLFIAPLNGNFQLQTGSPAISSGIAWPSVLTDFLSNPRPGLDGGIDRGAYQK